MMENRQQPATRIEIVLLDDAHRSVSGSGSNGNPCRASLTTGRTELVDVEPRPVPRQRLSDREWDALLKTSMAVIAATFRGRHVRDITEIATEAAMEAWPFDVPRLRLLTRA